MGRRKRLSLESPKGKIKYGLVWQHQAKGRIKVRKSQQYQNFNPDFCFCPEAHEQEYEEWLKVVCPWPPEGEEEKKLEEWAKRNGFYHEEDVPLFLFHYRSNEEKMAQFGYAKWEWDHHHGVEIREHPVPSEIVIATLGKARCPLCNRVFQQVHFGQSFCPKCKPIRKEK